MIHHLIIFLIRGLRPLLGPASCRFTISCTQYAIIQLQEESLFRALLNIGKRLTACNPFYYSGKTR